MNLKWSNPEETFNILLGLSLMSWAVLGIVTADDPARFTAVRLMIAFLHLSVAVLLIFRAPARQRGSPRHMAASLPALVISGWAINVAPLPQAWIWYAQLLFIAGGALTISAFFFLGRSFSIFPALRTVVVGGPYRYVRHPAYSGELLMIWACCLANPGADSMVPLFFAFPLIAFRILAEERLLLICHEYADYTRKVRWRLVPFLW